MGKESNAMKLKKLDDPYEDADRGEDVDFSGHRRKKRKEKRKHESGCGVTGEYASENVKADAHVGGGGVVRKKRKLELDNDCSVDPDKPRKNNKKRRYREAEAGPESDAIQLTGVDSYNGETSKKYEKGKFTREEDDDVRSISEGVKSNKKKKKQGHSLGEGDGIIDNGKKEGSKKGEDEGIADQLDSGNGDNQKNHQSKKERKEKKKKKTEEEGRKQGEDDDTTGRDDLGRDNQQKEKEKKERDEKKKKTKKKEKEGSIRGKYEDATDQLDSVNGNKRKNNEKIKEKKKEQEEKNKSKMDKPAKKSSRKVRFADTVEIFPSPEEGPSEGQAKGKDQLVHGKRFSPEEDALIEEAVNNYIQTRGLGENGLKMVLQCKENREIRNCWKDIGAALPWRPYTSVYQRAHILFERGKTSSWTEEEREYIRRCHEEHGSDWRRMADVLGKHRIHVKDTWRRIKLPNLNRGSWSQEEYQTLFNLVNKDLQMRALEEKVSKHGMLRDNICWGAISESLSTRTNANCCSKWYNQLTSSLVADGKWADSDDYRLLDALINLDACSMEEVDWDCLIENRSGAVCRKRWAQMLRHIGGNGTKSFADQVDILSKRYCPSLLEAREAFDNKNPKE